MAHTGVCCDWLLEGLPPKISNAPGYYCATRLPKLNTHETLSRVYSPLTVALISQATCTLWGAHSNLIGRAYVSPFYWTVVVGSHPNKLEWTDKILPWQSHECNLCVMEIVRRYWGVKFCPAAAWIEPSICRKERAHKLLIKYMLIWSCESRKGWQYLPVCTRCYVQHQAHILLNCAASTCLLAAIGWRYRYSKYCWTMSLIAMAPAGRLQPTRPRDHHYT